MLYEVITLPHLQALTSALPGPVVLSACGNTNGSMKALAASGADALSVDQTNDLVRSRAEVGDVLLFGNLDPVRLISQGVITSYSIHYTKLYEIAPPIEWPTTRTLPYSAASSRYASRARLIQSRAPVAMKSALSVPCPGSRGA